MATQNPQKHNFTAINYGKFKEVTHYEQTNFETENSHLAYFANISRNREFNNSKNVAFWYKSKELNGKKWGNCITGLKRTSNRNIYFGDIAQVVFNRHVPTHLLIFIFSNEFRNLQILTFKDFYPKDTTVFIENYISQVTIPL